MNVGLIIDALMANDPSLADHVIHHTERTVEHEIEMCLRQHHEPRHWNGDEQPDAAHWRLDNEFGVPWSNPSIPHGWIPSINKFRPHTFWTQERRYTYDS